VVLTIFLCGPGVNGYGGNKSECHRKSMLSEVEKAGKGGNRNWGGEW